MPNCYYYDEKRNRCNCYVNKNLDELLAENAKLRELVRDMGELLDVLTECDLACKHYHDGCIGDCYYVDARRELGVEVNA